MLRRASLLLSRAASVRSTDIAPRGIFPFLNLLHDWHFPMHSNHHLISSPITTTTPSHHTQNNDIDPNAPTSVKSPLPQECSFTRIVSSIKVTFVERDGTERQVEARIGQDLLSLAHSNGIDLEGNTHISHCCPKCASPRSM